MFGEGTPKHRSEVGRSDVLFSAPAAHWMTALRSGIERRSRCLLRQNHLVSDPTPVTVVDHHVHLFSPASKSHLEREIKRSLSSFTIDELLPIMDEERVASATVLSVAYFFDRPGAGGVGEDAVRAENQWLLEQTAVAPERLAAFFSVNPLSPGAPAEIERCLSAGRYTGAKLHFANSDVRLSNPEHLKSLRTVFRLMGEALLPVVVHLRTDGTSYGSEDVRQFLNSVLPLTDAPVQIAHAGGWGGYDGATASAMDELVHAVDRDGVTNLQLDLSAVVRRRGSDGPSYQRLADQLRSFGLGQVLFGTDWPDWTPRRYLSDLRRELPLADEEFDLVLRNRANYLP